MKVNESKKGPGLHFFPLYTNIIIFACTFAKKKTTQHDFMIQIINKKKVKMKILFFINNNNFLPKPLYEFVFYLVYLALLFLFNH